MQVSIVPSLPQIRYFASCALNSLALGFLSDESGKESAIGDLKALLSYLDALDNGENIVVGGIAPIEDGIRIESDSREGQVLDFIHRYRDPPLAKVEAAQFALAQDSHEKDMGTQANQVAEMSERNLDALSNG